MSSRIIQVRPSRNPRWQRQGGWEVYEDDGVCPVFCDSHARDSALSYAQQRAGYGACEIQVLDESLEPCRNDQQRRRAAASV